MVTIRQAEYSDIPAIMQFIEEHWKSGHILARDRDFFEWQFCRHDEVHMIVCIEDDTALIGIMGFILYNQSDTPDAAGSVWKMINHPGDHYGQDMQTYLKQKKQTRWVCSPGLGSRSIKLETMKGGIAGKLTHAYRLGYQKDFRIAKVVDDERADYLCADVDVELLDTEELFIHYFRESRLSGYLPYKDADYYCWRYYRHPIYQYQIYGIKEKDGNLPLALVCREVSHDGATALRIVEVIGEGEKMALCGPFIDKLLLEKGYEFVDLYSHGITEDGIKKCGLRIRTEDDGNIIPNFFEPFVQENIDIHFIYSWGDFKMFRGDGDQDRPSIPRGGEQVK